MRKIQPPKWDSNPTGKSRTHTAKKPNQPDAMIKLLDQV